MQQAQILKQKVLQLTPEEFDSLALEIFRYQAGNNLVYKRYVECLHIQVDSINSIEQIPFLPIEFFKTQTVITGEDRTLITFESSGTTGQNTSQHHVQDPDFYVEIAEQIFEKFYGKLADFQILALLPSYLERTNSSLVYMVEHFIKKSGSANSGFYLDDYEALAKALKGDRKQETEGKGKISIPKTLLIGVTFGLLDFAESGTAGAPVDLSFLQDIDNLIVMETGGMKGRRKELLREEVHEILTSAFHVENIHSEYGMTELLSQGYSKGEGIFELPVSMKIMLRDVNDPFHYISNSRSGGINVIDLANVDSCSFIETKDLGSWITENIEQSSEKNDENKSSNCQQFRILGRFDNSDIRGCNLMIQ
jgi:hypothetical protein